MLIGYNTNGLAFHRWIDALELLSEIGYESVAITLDHACLDPYSTGFRREIAAMRRALGRLGFASVIETGARFLLDPRMKHEPTLVSAMPADRARRIDFLKRAIDAASALESSAVSFWSGVVREPAAPGPAFEWLAAGCHEVAGYAAMRNVRLAFEPEPGMLVETFDQFADLARRVDAPHFGLTVDIGHVQCVESGPIGGYLREFGERIFNVHIEDMCRGVHEHLRFGEGEIDFPPVFAALREIGYPGGLHVELSRHSHMAPEVARESYEFLRRYVPRDQADVSA